MKRLLVVSALLAASASLFAAGSIKWKTSYESALSEAKASHKLVMVDFYTDWCGWCKKLDADTYPAPVVEKEAENFVPVKVNAEKEGKAAADKYKVTGYPTILFVQPDGTLAWKIVGYMPPDDFAKQMHLASTVSSAVPKLEAALKSNPSDATSAAKLVPYYGGTGKEAKITALMVVVDKGTLDPTVKADAYNAAGDACQNQNQNDAAIAYFQKAINPNLPNQTAYARISIAECYLAVNEGAKAKPYLEALVKMGPEAGAYGQQAQEILKQIKG